MSNPMTVVFAVNDPIAFRPFEDLIFASLGEGNSIPGASVTAVSLEDEMTILEKIEQHPDFDPHRLDIAENVRAEVAASWLHEEKQPVVTEVQAQVSAATVQCPHCKAELDGWVHDPRGREDTCDECGKPFHVATDATIKLHKS